MAREPHDLTLREASDAIHDGSLSSAALTDSVLQRADETEPKLNAYLTRLDDNARTQAAVADQELAAGRDRGPLHGIPFALKDLYDTAGIPTTGGSAFLRDRVPDQDAAVVTMLKRAGIVLTGKLGMVEFAFGAVGTNPHNGDVHNPWGLDHVTGGSSSGSGAAIAAGSCLGTLGSDTGGSIRIPAALCGVVGLMPTYGRVSRRGVLPLSWTLDHVGPLARTVEDAAMVLNAIAGYDAEDPGSADVTVDDFTSHLGRDIHGLRVGVPRDPFWLNLNPEVQQACEAALDVLRDLGATVTDIDLPLQAATPRLMALIYAEAAAYHIDMLQEHGDAYGPDVRSRIETGLKVPATVYLNEQRIRTQLIEETRQVFKTVDVLVSPTCATTAPAFADADGVQNEIVRLTAPYDVTGIPAISIPCGFDANGLPVGLMLGGRHFDEVTLCRVAHAYEQANDWHTRRPPV